MKPELCLLVFACVAVAPLTLGQSKTDPLDDLKSKWLAARQRVLKPVDETYLKQLEALKQAETKKGNLAAATRIAEEQERVKEELAMDPEQTFTADQVKAALVDTIWDGTAGLLDRWTVELKAGGTVVLTRPGNVPGWGGWTWSVTPKGDLVFEIPEQKGPTETRLSRRLDRISLAWGNGAALSRRKP